MANPWFRLWNDMVNDPKWRTISRVSGQKIGDVISTYLHMMTFASNATERGRTEGFNDEDVATALDINTEQVTAIRNAMQGRVLDGEYLTGWEKRQPMKEDGAAERARLWREAQKAEKERDKTQPNATERNRTLDEIREEEIRLELSISNEIEASSTAADTCPHQKIIALYHETLPSCPRIRDWTSARATQLRARWNEDKSRQNLEWWKKYFLYVGESDFLMGRTAKPFFADLEWITKSGNFTKIREGKYENRE